MDDTEQIATLVLVMLVCVKLFREAKGVLEPLPQWPAGYTHHHHHRHHRKAKATKKKINNDGKKPKKTTAVDDDEDGAAADDAAPDEDDAPDDDDADAHDWLTPEEEFDRWAKEGAYPGGKRLAVSASAVLMILLGVPVWQGRLLKSMPFHLTRTTTSIEPPPPPPPPPSLVCCCVVSRHG